MKKALILLTVLSSILTVSAAEIPAKAWVKSRMQGDFTFKNDGTYPISLKCTAPSAGTVVKKVGIWGRYLIKQNVETGKKYELKFTYKLTSESNGTLIFWTRGANIASIAYPKTAEARTITRQFTAKDKTLHIYFNLMRGIGELELISVELNQLD
ncbi:MAG: hypothetical protein IKC82_05065 [Lentisphaeria bacterium]|nr:hypothetical protein [Lentisphaeria bacterium]